MSARLKELAGRFDALQLRERWLVFLAVTVIFWLLVDSLAIAPMGKALAREQGKLGDVASQLNSNRQQLAALQSIVANDPLAIKARERDALQGQVSKLETELSELAGGLVKAEALPKILEDILTEAGNLQLNEMIASPPEEQLTGVYKHRVRVKISGGFTDVLRYLKALEQSPWQFYWEQLDYQVRQYPLADVDIQVYTLATAEGLFNG